MAVTRFGVSLESELLDSLDEFVKDNKFSNRSQAIRHLVEKNVAEHKWQCNRIVAGAITLLYDHHKRDISSKLNNVQHDFYDCILSSQHFHLDHDNCLEIIAIKGPASRLTELSELLIGIKGIKHGKLAMGKAD